MTVDDAHFRALFEPRGVVVAGASSHPGKFGFVALHNIVSQGYPGEVYATNRDGGTILGIDTVAGIDDIPADATVDLAFVCTPAAANPELLRACARRGIRAAFITSAGYGEAGDDGRVAERELVALARELDILLAGPNGQGVVSTPADLCAQIVAPYPPAGAIGVASQSGNFVSSFLNYAVQTGIGISRAVSAGNAAMATVGDYLDFYADDAATAVGLAYVEGIADGRAFSDRIRTVTERIPLVLLKGGATAGGQRAAASHTGALASDDRVFDGMCNQAGATRAANVEEAFEAAATFATQPLPSGPNVAVLTTAGGWGVVTADAITAHRALVLAPLPDDLRASIDTKLPPRWSRNNPIDLAGGETRDTIPEVMAMVAEHPDIDAVVYLGLGIQSNQARLMRDGPYYPGDGLERIVDYHERQDARFAQAAAEISTATRKPILTATELAVTIPDNPGPVAVRASGRLCYASSQRAVTALGHLYRYARFAPGAASRDVCAIVTRRGTLVRRVLAGGLGVLAVTLLVLGLRPPDGASAPEPAATLGTPLWSLRRLPQPVVDGVGAQHLQAALAGRTDGLQACTTVRDDTTGAEVARAGDGALAPGSTMKLLTATAAVAALGPDFHFTTAAVAPDAPDDGTVARLYLVGGGDPLLATPERIALDQTEPDLAGLPTSPLATLADRIAAAGVRRIPGGVIGVDDRYDRTRYLAEWPTSVRTDIGPIGALTVNDGRGGAAGNGAAVADPALNAATELGRLLAARGVAVGPAGRADHAPDAATRIATLDSPPLPKVLEELLSASDNLSAEMVTRELGVHAGAGTTPRGVQAIRDELAALRVDLTGASFIDGSGLSHDDRLTCATLLSVLAADAQPRFSAVADGLAIAGRRGTLALSLRGTHLEDNLRAKTGTLTGVSGLAGYVRSDRPLTFALLLGGGFSQNAGYALREAMASEIAAYPQVADASALVPAPFAAIPARACRSAEGAC